MGYKVIWTESAVSDVEHYAEYIARDSRTYASFFTSQIRTLAKALSQFPERGRIVPQVNRQDVREVITGNYRLIYQVMDQSVYIVAVEHGAQLLDIAVLKENLK